MMFVDWLLAENDTGLYTRRKSSDKPLTPYDLHHEPSWYQTSLPSMFQVQHKMMILFLCAPEETVEQTMEM